MKYLPLLIIGLLLFFCLGLADSSSEKKITSSKIIGDVVRMDVNNFNLPLRNDGKTGEDAQSWYPNGQTTASVLFSGGFGFTGYVNGELRASWMASAALIEEWQAAKWGMDPNDPLAKFYVVTREDGPGSAAYIDWANAVSLGADFIDEDGNGMYDPTIDRPTILGEKTIWTVFNDGTPLVQRTPRLGTQPMGLEIHQTIWAFDRGEELRDIIFFRFQLINVSDTSIQDLIFSVWDDPDIGDASDDLTACDTTLNMGYAYNDQSDAIYGPNPPAFGVKLLQGCLVDSPGDTAYVFRGVATAVDTLIGKRTLPLTAYMIHIGGHPTLGDPSNAQIARGYQEGGFNLLGNPIIPTQWGTGATASTNPKYFYSGNPVLGTGWIDTGYGDKKFLVNSGTFTMAPGDTQDIVFAYVVGRGDNALSSIVKMKERAAYVDGFFPYGHLLKIVASDTLIPVDSTFAFNLNLYNLAGNDSITSANWQLLESPAGSQSQIISSPDYTATLDPDLPGSYFVACSAALSDGGVVMDSLRVRAVVNHPPAAVLSITPATFTFGQSALADASSSSDPDGDPLTYFWDFPDWTSAVFTDSSESVDFMPIHTGSGEVGVTVSDFVFSDRASATFQVEPMENGLYFLDSTSVDTFVYPVTGVYITDVLAQNGNVYVSTNRNNLYILDGANQYQVLASYTINDSRFILQDSILISYGPNPTIDIYEFDNTGMLVHRSSISEAEKGDILLNYPYLYIMEAAGIGFLQVYDLSDLDNPQNISSLNIGAGNVDIAFSGLLAGYYSLAFGIISVDISDPLQIVPLDTLDIFSAEAKQIEYTNERIYVLNGNNQGNEITVIDASQPDNLQQAGVITVHTIIPGYSDKPVFAMNGYGNLLAVSCIDGIKIYNVDDPYNPVERVNFHNGFKSTVSAWNYPDLFSNFFTEEKVGNFLYRMDYDSTWVGIKNNTTESPIPENFQLLQNYPNPFNAGTMIRYELPQPAKVRLVIYNLLGQRVKSLVQGQQSAGKYSINWDGTSDAGRPVASGIYIYRISVDNYVQSRKMMLLK